MRFFAHAAALMFVLSLCTQVSWAAAAQGGAASEKARFDYALGLYTHGVYEPAVKELNGYLKDYPRGEYADEAYYWLGKYYMMGYAYEAGLENFRTILADFPAGRAAPLAQFEVARYFYEPGNPKHDYRTAMAEFLKIPFFYPESALVDKAAYYAAMCQVRLKDYDKAEAELDALAAKYPESELAAPALYQLGLCQALQGKTDAALADFQAVLDKYPSGLYRSRAQGAIELVARYRDKTPPTLSFMYGTKGGGPGMFSRPAGAAFDPEGALYVTDQGNGRVQRFKVNTSGLNPETTGLANGLPGKDAIKPAGICAGGPKALVYVVDQAMDRVQVFDPSGHPVASFGRKGSGLGELDSPAGIVVDEGGNVYVADRGNRRVEEFDREGRFIRAIGNSGPASGKLLKSPSGVALDLEGNLLVTDDSADRLYKYDDGGKLLAVYGDRQPGRPDLNEPASVSVDQVGGVYVANRGSRSVLILDKDLNPIMEFPADGKKILDAPAGIAISSSGQVFIVDQGLNKVLVFK